MNRSSINWVRVAAVFGAVGVLAGAFGAHGLRSRVSESLLAAYQTGVEYHLFHTLVLLSLGLYVRVRAANGWGSAAREGVAGERDGGRRDAGGDITERRWLGRACALFTLGILVFSGSLYGLALTQLRAFAWVTPLGGLSLVAGWIAIAIGFGSSKIR